MEISNVKDVSEFRNELIKDNDDSKLIYITTTHMLVDRGGVELNDTDSNNKSGKKFYAGDILISNIRPYFKKIWKANIDGITSNDVLIFKAKNNILNDYLYYVLSHDDFFEYATKTSKGTKMPRGDKKAIQNYSILLPDLEIQKKITTILGNFDRKIEVNNKIIDNLEQQAQVIFKSWFIDFEPFQDGEFVDSELGSIPKGWEVKTIADISNVTSGRRPKEKNNISGYPLIGANGKTGWSQDYNYDSKIIVIGRVGTLGSVQRYNERLWASDNTLVFNSSYYELLFYYLKMIDYSALNRGSTQPLVSQGDIKKIKLILPNNNIIEKFSNFTSNIFDIIWKFEKQNQKLAETRDLLLPKLMSGEIDVSDIDF